MKVKKLVIALIAQNYAGKTSVAKKLCLHYKAIHYSMRDIIRNHYKEIYKTHIPNDDTEFKKFSLEMKAMHGSEFFLVNPLEEFEASPYNICVIESLRAPGEALWFLTGFNKDYPKSIALPIGITAPYDERLKRSLRGRDDEITERTELAFQLRERNSNKGKQVHEENIDATLGHAIQTFSNSDNPCKEEKVVSEIITFIDSYVTMVT